MSPVSPPTANGDDPEHRGGVRGREAAGRARSERARQAILRSTLRALEQRGANNLSIEGIAADAGVGKTTIYRWWPNRIALVLDAIEQLPELEARDLGCFADELSLLLRDLTTLLMTTPLGGVLAHLGAEGAARDPAVADYLARRMGGAVTVVERAVARGELPSRTDATSVVYLAMGPVLNRCFYGPPPDDEFLDLVVATVVAGLPTALAREPG